MQLFKLVTYSAHTKKIRPDSMPALMPPNLLHDLPCGVLSASQSVNVNIAKKTAQQLTNSDTD